MSKALFKDSNTQSSMLIQDKVSWGESEEFKYPNPIGTSYYLLTDI